MEKDIVNLVNLLTSDSVLTELLEGVVSTNPSDPDSILFSDALRPGDEHQDSGQWTAIPKGMIAYMQPIGSDVKRMQGDAPQRYRSVRLLLRKPEDRNSAALAQLLDSALFKLAAFYKNTNCSCGSAYPSTPFSKMPCARGRGPYRTPDLCPDDDSVIDKTGIGGKVIGFNRMRWTASNGRQKKVRIYPLASSFDDGHVISETCWPYVEVEAGADFVVGDTNWPTGNGPITGTAIRMYHSYELP